MPIYAYKCSSCGHEKDVLQKISEAPLAECPACGAASFSKQLTAAGFQLKGSGWYATDFRNGSAKPEGKPAETKTEGGDAKPAADSPAKPAAPAAAAAPACGSGGCAACT
jgi:putative FmdB family regulatory protein